MQDCTTVLIIDDHPLFREGLKSVMKIDPRFKVIGEADNGITGLEMATELQPDITLTDISMPGMDGIELTRRLKNARPEARVVILSMHTGINHISSAMQAGATGYLIKGSAPNEILDGIMAIANNQTFIDRNISQSISSEVMGIKVLEHYETQKSYEKLTPREQQILRGLAEEYSHRELAEQFSISPKTVENHRSNIMKKLGIKREVELIRFAGNIGLIDTSI